MNDYEEAEALVMLIKREDALAKLLKRMTELARIAADNDARTAPTLHLGDAQSENTG